MADGAAEPSGDGRDPFALLGALVEAVGRERESDFERVATAYLSAVVHGQVFESCCKLAEPALRAPVDDEEAAARLVRQGDRRSLHEALQALGRLGSPHVTGDLLARMDRARVRRNHLAHEWVWHDFPLVASGRAGEVLAALERDQALFQAVVEEVFSSIFRSVVEARGLSMEEVGTAAAAVAAGAIAVPGLIDGIRLPGEFEEAGERLLRWLASASGDQPA